MFIAVLTTARHLSHPEPDESSPRLLIPLTEGPLKHYSSTYPRAIHMVYFHHLSPRKPSMHVFRHACVPHTLPITFTSS